MAGFWKTLLASLGHESGSEVFTPNVTYLGASDFAALMDPSKMTAIQMWKTQPHFRTVVSFLARNVAQLGLHVFERVGEDRRRDRDSVLAQVLEDVDGTMTTYDLIFALVGDLALYDRAYWLVVRNTDAPSGWMIRRLPPAWVEPKMADPWEVEYYRVYVRNDGGFDKIAPSKILAFTGYHPGKGVGASPTVDALRETLQEQVEAAKYRAQVWKRGGRVSSVLQRPALAPAWSDAAREAFREDWYAKYTGRGPKAGGTPILEDGMTLQRIDFNAQEQQFVEAAKLSLTTVAAAFHVNPTMIGQNEGATYSNVREFRKMLYGDTLGPTTAQIDARINRFLIPMLGMDRRRSYVEFNIEEKLQGNFEEQSQALQVSTGAPWMTRNEARAIRNLPALPGGDALVTPLNVLIGGQASPRDSGSQNVRSAPPRVKERAPETHQEQVRRVLSAFFERQARVVKSRLGAKADDDWWDQDRWDRELSDDLYRLAVTVSEKVAQETLEAIGFGPDAYDVDRTLKFLRAVSDRVAGAINATTLAALEAAMGEEDPQAAVSDVFEVAAGSRSEQSAGTFATTMAGFATAEAAKQAAGDRAMKRWQVNSANPRPSHAAMNGETVGIDDVFSNGARWPGGVGDPDEDAGCTCSLVIVTS